MKSTLKIYNDRNYGGSPVIKIIQPLAVLKEIDDPITDIDEKDILIRDFLLQKGSNNRVNQWFRLDANFTAPEENPTHQINTIRPVDATALFFEFKIELINMLPNSSNEDLTIKYPKVFEFFDWMSNEIIGNKKSDTSIS